MSSPDKLTQILTMVLIMMVILLIVLAVIYIAIKLKTRKKKEEEDITKEEKNTSDAKKIAREYTKQSIMNFMEFDKIEDNMIIQKNGNRYIMVIECQGVNYDLMSEAEKISVEEGFLQFLNTLRHPIQIYIQTRTVNLNDSIENYQSKLDEIEYELDKKRDQYLKHLNSGEYTKEELEREFYEVTKQTNLYEYGKDIIANTQRMSLNKSVLNQKYFIVVPYYSEELGNNAFDKEEIKDLAFTELYNKAQSIIRTLSGCEVSGRIMKSDELVDLLYVAYNRDEAEVFSVDRAIRAGFDELYTTAPDVLDKKMRVLDEEIERKALQMVNEKVVQARSKKQQEVDRRQAEFGELIRKRAEMILRQNAGYLGNDTTETAIDLINEEENTNEEGGTGDAREEKKKTTRRKTTTSKQQ
ncbi:MAG: hypothetical protein HFJ57_07170 [Clostridia bacterium]|nr:hypothetical protein [Clostridia bacterium]